jgi:hypothetical protein
MSIQAQIVLWSSWDNDTGYYDVSRSSMIVYAEAWSYIHQALEFEFEDDYIRAFTFNENLRPHPEDDNNDGEMWFNTESYAIFASFSGHA